MYTLLIRGLVTLLLFTFAKAFLSNSLRLFIRTLTVDYFSVA